MRPVRRALGFNARRSFSSRLFPVRYLCHHLLNCLLDGVPDRIPDRALHFLMIEVDIGIFPRTSFMTLSTTGPTGGRSLAILLATFLAALATVFSAGSAAGSFVGAAANPSPFRTP